MPDWIIGSRGYLRRPGDVTFSEGDESSVSLAGRTIISNDVMDFCAHSDVISAC